MVIIFAFKDILTESGIVTMGSLKGVLSGKHYNRSVWCHKVVHEAMERIRFEAFLETLNDDELEGINLVVQNFMDLYPGKNFVDALDEPVLDELFKRYDEFIQAASVKSRTFAY